MNRSTYRFTLDLQKHRSQMAVAVFAHDSAVRFIISLTDGGNHYSIEEGGRAVFYGKRPDDIPLCHNCMIDDTGRVIYDFNDQTAAIEGITQCQIRIYGKDGELITAPRFIIVADERLVYDEDIEKLEDSPLAALDAIQFAEIDRVVAEKAREEAEKGRVEAEEARTETEEARGEAEAERAINESERVVAEAQRASNENARIESVKNHEKRITNLEKKVSPSFFETDDSIAYRKSVPTDACPYAQVNSVGGMSYKTNNLIPFPYASSSKTENGITWTINEDGSVTANGTATGLSTFSLIKTSYLDANTDYGTATLSGCPSGGSDETYHIYSLSTGHRDVGSGVSFPLIGIYLKAEIRIMSGYTANNLVFKPMWNLGSTALPYEPFFEGLRHSKVTELVSEGSNYFDISKISSRDDNLGKLVVDGDNIHVTRVNSLTVPPNGNPKLKDICPNLQVGETYTIYAETTSTYKNIYLAGTGVWTFGKSKTMTEADLEAGIYFYGLNVGDTTTISKIRVNKGTTYYDWHPYSAEPIDTLEIPEEVQALEGWGLGIDAEHNNRIEWRNGRAFYIQMLAEYEFKGTEHFFLNSYLNNNGFKGYQIAFITAQGVAPICSHFEGKNWGEGYYLELNVVRNISGTHLVFLTNGVQTIEEFKAFLAERYANGNPVTIVYALETPIETDITEYFTKDNFIEVEGGGTITAKNDYGNAVPSSITYMLKESESV